MFVGFSFFVFLLSCSFLEVELQKVVYQILFRLFLLFFFEEGLEENWQLAPSRLII
jgi:hypothetical protein